MESCCERWGSIVHQLWDGVAGLPPQRVVARLHIREACIAKIKSTAEELVVREITNHMFDQLGMNPFVKRGQQSQPAPTAPVALEPNVAIRRALRESMCTRAIAKELAEPAQLPDAASQALARAVRLGKEGALEALPVFFEDQRIVQRDRAGSTVRAREKEWATSTECAEWLSSRSRIFGDGRACLGGT